MKRIEKALDRWRKARQLHRAIGDEYGWRGSLAAGIPQDRQGRSLPWYTYSAIEFLAGIDFGDKDVFEWGCGHSSLYWARRARHVTSVEDNRAWFEKVDALKAANNSLIYAEEGDAYVNAIRAAGRTYDVIVVDGAHRRGCASVAPACLNDGGLIILDNADWYPRTRREICEAGFTEIPFCGFGPLNGYAWVTAIYLRAAFSCRRCEYRVLAGTGGTASDD